MASITWEEKFPPDYLIEAVVQAKLFTMPLDRPWKKIIVSKKSVSYNCKCDPDKQIFYQAVTFKDEEYYVGQCPACGRIVYCKC